MLQYSFRQASRLFIRKTKRSIYNNYQTTLATPLKQFYSRSNKKQSPKAQVQHWHISNIESIVNDLEIIYQSSQKQSEDSLIDLKGQSQLILNVRRDQILSRFQQFNDAFIENKAQMQKNLKEINLTTEQILKSLESIAQSVNQFCRNSQSMSLHELHAKSNILSFIVKQVFKENSKRQAFHQLVYILEVEIKLKSTFNYFDSFQSNDQNITNSHPSLYPEVWKHIQIETFDDRQKIIKKYKEIQVVLHATIGAIEKSERYKNNILEKIVLGIHLPINFIKYEWSLLNSLMLYRTANPESYRKFLNLYEDGLIRFFTQYVYFPKIETNMQIYIPPEGDFNQNLDIFKQNKDHILVRVLYYKELPLIKKENKNDSTPELENIIVHMHGGGFVGLSSHTTQNYTRPWANQLKMPLFSIDYRMPPTHPFPHAPNDCLQVYKFLTTQLHRYIRIRPKNVYVCGDSAGGNLSCSLTALTMKNGLLKPKGLFLAYPCTDVRMVYYPSRKFLLNDPILWPSIAEMFFNSYTSQSQRSDPIASPVLLTQEYLGRTPGDKRFPLDWPLTYMTVGSKDMLRDQCLLLMQKMIESKVPCKCYLFEHLCHAFFSTERMMQQSNQAFKHSIGAFKELVERSKQEHI